MKGLLALEGAVAHALATVELPESCGAAGGGVGHMHAQQRPLPPYDKGFASVSLSLVSLCLYSLHGGHEACKRNVSLRLDAGLALEVANVGWAS